KFDDTAARRGAAAGKTRQLDVDHRAVEFRHARNAAAAEAALIEAARTHFLRKVRRQFVPRRNDDFVLDAGVVGENHVSLRAVTKQDRKSTRLNSSHQIISYAVFCLKKKTLY